VLQPILLQDRLQLAARSQGLLTPRPTPGSGRVYRLWLFLSHCGRGVPTRLVPVFESKWIATEWRRSSGMNFGQGRTFERRDWIDEHPADGPDQVDGGANVKRHHPIVVGGLQDVTRDHRRQGSTEITHHVH
jgi:hypothetical protein